jgi:hypothetical protein
MRRGNEFSETAVEVGSGVTGHAAGIKTVK